MPKSNVTKNNWKEEWAGMPEYANEEWGEPEIVVKFMFKSKEDYDNFYRLLKEKVFLGERPFNGSQRKDRKSTWFPHKEKGSKYYYIDSEMLP